MSFAAVASSSGFPNNFASDRVNFVCALHVNGRMTAFELLGRSHGSPNIP
jgi:hypothetical protein